MIRKYYIQNKKGGSDRLDKLISKNLKLDQINTFKLINQGSVWDNKKMLRFKDPSTIITDQLILINSPEFPVVEYILDKNDIIYEDQYILAVYKKCGYPTCPTPYADIHSLEYAVNTYYQKSEQLFPVNRIDMPTDGIVLFSKNRTDSAVFYNLFSDRNITKAYLAVTPRIAAFIGRTIRIDKPVTFKGVTKNAKTIIRSIANNDNFQFFIAYPLTGRTHQIRIHFAENITPLIGDATYGKYNRIDRLGLTCVYYRFVHPFTKKTIRIKLPIFKIIDSFI